MRLAALFSALLFASPALAATPYEIYASGRYDDAMKLGDANADAATLAIAARAALADAALRDKPCLDCLHRAEDFAARAVAKDPRSIDGHVYHAIAMGLEARIQGAILSRLRNYPGRAKDDLDAALSVDPHDPSALGALGGWNIEIVRIGGAALGNLFYGATVDKGLAAFRESFAADPADVTVRYQYALSLSGFDTASYIPQIKDAFSKVIAGNAKTVYERTAQTRAGQLYDLMMKNDYAAFGALVWKYQGYPPK